MGLSSDIDKREVTLYSLGVTEASPQGEGHGQFNLREKNSMKSEEEAPLLDLKNVKESKEPKVSWKASALTKQERDPLLNPWGKAGSVDPSRG